jgi:hypothetical protein
MENKSCVLYKDFFRKYSDYFTKQQSTPEQKEYFKKLYSNYLKLCLTK